MRSQPFTKGRPLYDYANGDRSGHLAGVTNPSARPDGLAYPCPFQELPRLYLKRVPRGHADPILSHPPTAT